MIAGVRGPILLPNLSVSNNIHRLILCCVICSVRVSITVHVLRRGLLPGDMAGWFAIVSIIMIMLVVDGIGICLDMNGNFNIIIVFIAEQAPDCPSKCQYIRPQALIHFLVPGRNLVRLRSHGAFSSNGSFLSGGLRLLQSPGAHAKHG